MDHVVIKDIKIVSKMLQNLEEIKGEVKFKAPIILTAPTQYYRRT